jgi:hypothetical protein
VLDHGGLRSQEHDFYCRAPDMPLRCCALISASLVRECGSL